MLPFVYAMDPGFEVARIPSAAGAAELRPNPERLDRVTALLQLAFREAQQPGAPYVDWFADLARVSRRFDHASPPTVTTAEQR
jgi:hypothetical protein